MPHEWRRASAGAGRLVWVLGLVLLMLVPAGCASRVSGEPADPDLVVPVALGLRRDMPALQQAAWAASEPRSDHYLQWWSGQQIARSFGAPSDVVTTALDTARSRGFVGDVHPSGGLLVGSMTVSDAEDLLGVTMVVIETARGDVVRPDRPLTVPSVLAPAVTEVAGLSALLGDAPPPEPTAGAVPTACMPAAGLVDAIRSQYGLTELSARDSAGAGVRLALLAVSPYSQRSLDVYHQCYDRPVPRVSEHLVGPSVGPGADITETTLDILAVSLIAPGVSELDLYRFNPFTTVVFPLADATADALTGQGPTIVSTSVGFCETEISDAAMTMSEWLLAAGALGGVSVVAASGDDGSSGCAPGDTSQRPQYPASSPWVTGVGGTQYADAGVAAADVATPGSALSSGAEVVWNESPIRLVASGGATTSRLPKPAYQQGVVAGGARVVPDVAFLASPTAFGAIPVCSGVAGCAYRNVGGTSATAPGFAAALAVLAAEQQSRATGNRLGAINPALYSLAQAPSAPSIFTDVTAGTNDLYRIGCCTAGPGFDAASGWGSVNFGRLIDALRVAPPH